MKNPIYENREDLDFIEENIEELSKCIGSAEHVNEYYIDVFRQKKAVFNMETFIWGGWWFGYRKMYLLSFLIPLISSLISRIILLLMASESLLAAVDANLYLVIVQIIPIIILFFIAIIPSKYANYMYFRTLKNRIVNKKRSKDGTSFAGAFGGMLLSILGSEIGRVVVDAISTMMI